MNDVRTDRHNWRKKHRLWTTASVYLPAGTDRLTARTGNVARAASFFLASLSLSLLWYEWKTANLGYKNYVIMVRAQPHVIYSFAITMKLDNMCGQWFD